jgi:hypothetical protein
MHRRLIVVAVGLLAVAAGCASSPPSVMSTKSPFNQVPDTTTTIDPVTGDSSPAAVDPGLACSVVTAADVTAAGVPGQISTGATPGGSGNGPATSDCILNVAARNTNSTLTVRVETGGKAVYDRDVADQAEANPQFVVTATPIAGLGDEAAVRTTTIKSQGTAFDENVYVLHGDSVMTIGCIATVATSAELVALARRANTNLG